MKPIFKNYFKLSAMKEERLDNIFQQELGQYDSGTPEHLWADIEAQREKTNRPAAAWWATGLAMIFVVGLSGWYLLTPDSNLIEKEPTVKTSAPIADATSIPPTFENEDKTQQALVSETAEEIQAVSTPVLANKVFVEKNEAVPNSTVTTISDFLVVEKSGFEVAKNEAPTASPNENATDFSANLSASAEAKKEETPEIARLPQLKSDLLSINLGEIKGPEGCYNFGGGSNGPLLDALSFDLIGGPGIAIRKLENTGDSEFDYHVAARDSTESQWYEFGATLRANFRYTSGLVLRGGLNYSQINEIFEIRDGNATQTTEIRDADGNVIEVIVQEGELYKKIYNRLRFIDIPVMLGYEWSRKKWTFAINAGPSFNYQFSQRGQFLDENLDAIVFTTGKDNQSNYFKDKIGINFVGSVGISRQLTNKLDWHIEPQVRYMPESVGTTNIEQRYTNIGIYTGLRYYFVCRQRK